MILSKKGKIENFGIFGLIGIISDFKLIMDLIGLKGYFDNFTQKGYFGNFTSENEL